MKTYLIGYDLNRPEQDYPGLIAAIKATFSVWWHNLDSTWIVKSNKTAVEICNALKLHIDASDELLVIEVTREAAWIGFKAKSSDWLKNNL